MSVYVPLNGSKRELLPNSRAAGPVDPTELASLTIRVRSVGKPEELVQLASELGNKAVADRQYLSHAELEAQHGASAADLDAIEQFATRHNLLITHRSTLDRTVRVTGPLRDLLAAFHANVHMYHHSSGTYRGRQGEITIPQELSDIVTGVFGFDTRAKRRTRHQRAGSANGPGGDNGVLATEFAARYKFPAAAGGVALDGSGQTIAIIELGGGYRTTDLRAFFAEAKIAAPHVTSIAVDHIGNKPTNANSADGEVMLDIEVAGAVAPKAKIAVYFGPNSGDKGFLDTISAAIHDTQRKPSVISISWGGPESTNDQQGIQAFHELFAAAGALGITICVASGDHGCADLDSGDWDKKIHVDHPACDDLVLACGGTQIDAAGADVVWNDGTPFDPTVQGGGGWTSGGGISQVIPVPSYQSNVKLPPALDNGKPGRGVPDLAMTATNYFTRVDGLEGASGGTSAVAPLMAGLIARLNQAKHKNIGFLNPFLYKNPNVLHDVTTGTNAIKNSVAGYHATAGWDPCTGLGTPDGNAILTKL